MVNRKPTGKPPGRPRLDGLPSGSLAIDEPLTPEEESEDREAATVAAIKGFFNDGPGDAVFKVMVHRVISVPGKAQRTPWLFDIEINELEELRQKIVDEEWGPGRYRCRVFKNNVPWKQYDIEVELAPRLMRAKSAAGLSGVASDTQSPAVVALFERMNDRMDRTDRLLETLMMRVATPATSTAAATVKETVEAMISIQNLIPKTEPNIGLEMFQKGMDFAKQAITLGGASGGDGDGGGFLDKILSSPIVTDLVKKLTEPSPAGPPAGARQLPPTPALAAAPPNGQISMLPPALVETMNFLVIKAAEGAQPDLFADYVVEKIPQQVFEHLAEQSDIVGYLESFFPAIAQHRPWFTALIDHLFEPSQGAAPVEGAADDMRVPGH